MTNREQRRLVIQEHLTTYDVRGDMIRPLADLMMELIDRETAEKDRTIEKLKQGNVNLVEQNRIEVERNHKLSSEIISQDMKLKIAVEALERHETKTCQCCADLTAQQALSQLRQ